MPLSDKDYLLELAKTLDELTRQGNDVDVPEGVRIIQFSDTLAKEVSEKLREIVGRM